MANRPPHGVGPPQRHGAPPAGIGFNVPPPTEHPPGFAPSAPSDPSYGLIGPRPNAPVLGPPPSGLLKPGTASVGQQPDRKSAPGGQYQQPSTGLSGWQVPKGSHNEGRPHSQERGASRASKGQGPGWEKLSGISSGSRSSEKIKPRSESLPPTTQDKGVHRGSGLGPYAPGIVPGRQGGQGSSGSTHSSREPSQPSRQRPGPILGIMGAPPLIGFLPPESGTGRSGYPKDVWSNGPRLGPPGANTAGASWATARKSSEGSDSSGGSQKSRDGSRSRSRRSRKPAEEKEILEAIKKFEALL